MDADVSIGVNRRASAVPGGMRCYVGAAALKSAGRSW